MTARPIVVLPQPDSPTRPSVSPARKGQAHAVDGTHGADRPAQEPCCGSGNAPAGPRWRAAACAPAAATRSLRARRRRTGDGTACSSAKWQATAVLAPIARSGGILRRAARSRSRPSGAARMERAARRQVPRCRRLAGNRIEPRCRALRSAARSAAGPPCRDGAAARRYRARWPVSTMRPPYMTATRCATSATTPRSCVIRITAAPVSAWRRASRASTCACTVTSRAVVGSSAMISFGCPDIAMAMTARWRMPAGELVRILRGARLGGRRSRPRASSSHGARRARCRPRARPRATCPSMIWRPTGSTGLSVVVGSWKTKPTSRPRSVPQRLGIGADDLGPDEADRSRDLRVVRQQARDGERT